MRRWLRHRWLIGGAALLLVLMLGAVAWAQTGSTATTTPTTRPAYDGRGAGPSDWGMMGGPGPSGGRGMMGRHGGFGGSDETQQYRQERLDAIRDLVRDKMSDEDKAAFDKLLQQQETQREAVQKAMEDLRSTNEQLRTLVDKYLGVEKPATTTTTAPSGGSS